MNKLIITCVWILLATTCSIPSNAAQQHSRKKFQQKIEDLRKIKLLDVLNLEGDQVEKFFAAYNKHQAIMEKYRTDIESMSQTIQDMISNNSSEADLSSKVEQLRKMIRDRDKEIDARFDAVKSVLTSRQYAQYVVFETRFHDELQRKIIDRFTKRRNQP